MMHNKIQELFQNATAEELIFLVEELYIELADFSWFTTDTDEQEVMIAELKERYQTIHNNIQVLRGE